MKKCYKGLKLGYSNKNTLAKTNNEWSDCNLENNWIREKFSKKNIIKKRLQLLRLLEIKVKEGDLRAIELYNKILSEIRDDLGKEENEDDWIAAVESLMGGCDDE